VVDRGTVHLEVVVVLGVDLVERLRGPHLEQVVHHAGGGVRGVVPAFEGHHHHGVHEVRDIIHRLHRNTLRPRLLGACRPPRPP
jgi:hypothetical protein